MNIFTGSQKRKTTLKFGFSSCPNDTFIVDAIVNKRIDIGNFILEPVIAGVEALNNMALANALDVTKVSINTFFKLSEHWVMLDAGAALGHKNGPLLVAKSFVEPKDFNKIRVAIPGRNTTANLLLTLSFPEIKHKTEMLFSEIEDAVINGRVDAGLIIHETRFTYAEKGLVKLADMGEYWEAKTGLPVPLGGFIAKRSLNPKTISALNTVFKNSVAYAFTNPDASREFVKIHAQELSKSVIEKHIALYVNEFTQDLGSIGKNAIEAMFKIASESGFCQYHSKNLFLSAGKNIF